jgi:glycosyltransferase involved in cell wall biosynthesis
MSLRVAIGVCVKNSEKTIWESINSIINQKYPAELVQVIIVDGCSKDDTISIVTSETARTDMKVETYSDEGKGLGAARQIVVNNANGKYIIFADADVVLFDDFVENHVRFMEENPDIGVAFGRPMYQEGTLVSTIWNLRAYAGGGFIGNDATIYRSEALRQVGGFDANIKGAAEDTDLIARIQAKGWLISINERARFFHKFRETLRDFWDEQSWFGYGDHYVNHRNENVKPLWHRLPIASFPFELGLALKAYELTHRKISLLIPLQAILGNISWWFGFIKGHKDGYGHRTRR